MSRKICVVTGTRADFGLLRWLMEAISNYPELTLQVVATGMHLSPDFGSTYREIEINESSLSALPYSAWPACLTLNGNG